MFSRTLFSRLPKPLSCRIIAPLLTQYVEAEASLTASERAAVGAHLSACPACHEETAAVRAMGNLLRSRGPVALPAHVPARDLWDRIEGRIVTEQRESRRSLSLRPVLLFAPALVAMVVAVVMMPKPQQPLPSATTAARLETDGTAGVSPKSAAAPMIAMEEVGAADASRVTPPTGLPAASLAASARVGTAGRREAMVASIRERGLAPESRRQIVFASSVNAVPAPRNRRNAKMIAQSLATAKPMYHEITIVEVDTKPAPTMVAMARIPTVSEPRPVAPPIREAESHLALTNEMKKAAITVVSSDPGSGVTATAYAPPPVTDTMIRQRQRRGLFGGYGVGGAMIGTLPAATSGAGAGSETAAPW